jgi:hypothetical protein
VARGVGVRVIDVNFLLKHYGGNKHGRGAIINKIATLLPSYLVDA